jgi:hypothetical protein
MTRAAATNTHAVSPALIMSILLSPFAIPAVVCLFYIKALRLSQAKQKKPFRAAKPLCGPEEHQRSRRIIQKQ